MPIIDTLPPQQQIEYVVLQNARAVNDIATFYFRDYNIDGIFAWVGITVIPDHESGSGTIPGGYVDGKTGTIVTPPNGEMVVVKKGKWKLISAAQPDYPTTGTFEWNEPMAQNKRKLTPEDFYSPFSYGGVIVFKPNPGGRGLDQFQFARVIFPRWKDMVQPAFANAKQNSNLLDGLSTRNDEAALANMTKQSNALLSALALRESIRLELVPPQSCSNLLHGREPDLVSLYANLMITTSSPRQQNEWLKELLGAIKKADHYEYLQAIALGAYSAVIFRSMHKEIRDNGITVLNAINQRVKALKVVPKQAPQLYFILEKSGIN